MIIGEKNPPPQLEEVIEDACILLEKTAEKIITILKINNNYVY